MEVFARLAPQVVKRRFEPCEAYETIKRDHASYRQTTLHRSRRPLRDR
jgi:hypothetical protein